MKPEEQRIAIAEVCGWDSNPHAYTGSSWGIPAKFPVWNFVHQLPDYLNDLNAMQSAVNNQTHDFQQEFNSRLISLPCFIHQSKSTQWAEIFIAIALRKGIIRL